MDRREGLELVRAAVADCLALDLEEVRPESRLITDLGADSLDFVDLVFMLEKKFKVKLRGGDMSFLSQLDLTSPEVVRDGFLTPGAVERLAPWLPSLATLDDPAKITPGQLFSLITVETFWIMLERRLG